MEGWRPIYLASIERAFSEFLEHRDGATSQVVAPPTHVSAQTELSVRATFGVFAVWPFGVPPPSDVEPTTGASQSDGGRTTSPLPSESAEEGPPRAAALERVPSVALGPPRVPLADASRCCTGEEVPPPVGGEACPTSPMAVTGVDVPPRTRGEACPSEPAEPAGDFAPALAGAADPSAAVPEAKARCFAELGIASEWSSDLSDWSVLVWADNLGVMASKADGLAARRRAYERALGQLGLHVLASSHARRSGSGPPSVGKIHGAL